MVQSTAQTTGPFSMPSLSATERTASLTFFILEHHLSYPSAFSL